MSDLTTAAITEEQVQEFERAGAICLRGLFDAYWVERLRAECERIIEMQKHAPDFDPGFITDRVMWPHNPEIRAFAFESPAAKIAKRMMRANSVRLYFDHLFIKEPGTNGPSPWHHDQPFWPVLGHQVCSVWLALDYVTKESSGLEYVAGSHRWGKRFRPQSPGFKSLPTDELLPDIEAGRGRHEMLNWDMAPGDCLVHHALTVHGSSGNSSLKHRRRALATRWLGDDAVYAPEAGSDAKLLDPTLRSGQPFDSARFPRVKC